MYWAAANHFTDPIDVMSVSNRAERAERGMQSKCEPKTSVLRPALIFECSGEEFKRGVDHRKRRFQKRPFPKLLQHLVRIENGIR